MTDIRISDLLRLSNQLDEISHDCTDIESKTDDMYISMRVSAISDTLRIIADSVFKLAITGDKLP